MSDVTSPGKDRVIGQLGRPWVAGLLLCAAGVLAGLGQAPWGLWPVALPGYALALWVLAQVRRPFLSGWLFGIAHFALVLHWMVEPFLVDAAATGWLAGPALIAVAAGMGLFWGLAARLGRALGGAPAIAICLAGAELVRAYIFTGFPWAMPGHILIDSAALPSASLLGAHGLGIAVLAGSGLTATLRPGAMGAGVALWALPFALAAMLPPAPQTAPDAPVLRLVQPNAPQHQKWDPAFIPVFFQRGLEATAATADGATPAAVIWPETSLPELLRYSETVRPMIANASGGTPVVIGAQRYGEDGQPRNSLALLEGADGAVTLIHDKHRLVPFGEFLPLPRVAAALGIGPLAQQLAGRYAPGEGPITFDLPGVGPVMPMICYEAIFPQDLRRVDRPRAILHLTNDAWFGAHAGPQQHLALARLRAAEAGLPVLRAANTGVSAVIDARGRVLDHLSLDTHGHLDAPLPAPLGVTLYMRTGDWVALLLIVCLLATLALRRRKAVAPRGDPL